MSSLGAATIVGIVQISADFVVIALRRQCFRLASVLLFRAAPPRGVGVSGFHPEQR